MRTADTGRQGTAGTSDRLEDGMDLEYAIEVEEFGEDDVMHTVVTLGRYGDWCEAVDTARILSGCLKCDLDVVVYEYGEYESGIEVYRL